MKKTSLLMSIIIGLVLINGLALASLTNPNPKQSSTLGSKYQADPDYFIMYYQGVTIPTGSVNYVDVTIERILDWDGLLLRVIATDGDTITTASITFLDPDGYTVSSDVMTNGVVYTTTLETPTVRVRAHNPSGNVETVATLNISAWND